MEFTTIQILEFINLAFILVWGLAYGVANWTNSIRYLFNGTTSRQSTFGRIIDATWLILLVLTINNGSLINTLKLLLN